MKRIRRKMKKRDVKNLMICIRQMGDRGDVGSRTTNRDRSTKRIALSKGVVEKNNDENEKGHGLKAVTSVGNENTFLEDDGAEEINNDHEKNTNMQFEDELILSDGEGGSVLEEENDGNITSRAPLEGSRKFSNAIEDEQGEGEATKQKCHESEETESYNDYDEIKPVGNKVTTVVPRIFLKSRIVSENNQEVKQFNVRGNQTGEPGNYNGKEAPNIISGSTRPGMVHGVLGGKLTEVAEDREQSRDDDLEEYEGVDKNQSN